MMKHLRILNDADLPIYEQLYNQIVVQILRGELKAHTNLPSIRTAAKELNVSVITIKRAWDDLEQNQYVYTIAGKGTFVSDLSNKTINDKKNQILDDKLRSALAFYKKLGVEKQKIIDLIEKIYSDKT